MRNNFLHNNKILKESNTTIITPRVIKNPNPINVDINKLLNRVKIENKRKKHNNIKLFSTAITAIILTASILYF